jgi:cullin-associated NEDD8-dissociated protein 1
MNTISAGLDTAVKPFDGVLKTKLKETAVKQEVEKLAEMQRSALRTMASLLPLASNASIPKFMALCDETRNSALWGVDFKEMIRSAADNKSSANNVDRMEID